MVKFILCLHISVSILTVEFGKIYWTFLISSISELFNNSSRTNFFRVRKSDTETVFSATPTGYNSRWDAINVGGCLLGRFFSKINRISTEFFFKYKKIAKIIINIFFDFFFQKIFLWTFFFTNVILVKILLSNFFGENLSFHKTICAKIFFTIFSRISFEFDVCEIMYFAECFIRNFAYCEFFCFAILVYGKIIVNFFCDFFFSDERECQIWKCFFSGKK